MSMMCRPKWPVLLMCVFHDVRHVDFRGLTGSQRTPRNLGHDRVGIDGVFSIDTRLELVV